MKNLMSIIAASILLTNLTTAQAQSLSTGEAYCQEYRIRNHKGKYIKVRDQGFALRRIIGIIEIL